MINLYEIESGLRAGGFTSVCGVDEAGRGPLAGPVYAAAVILREHDILPGLDDSKKLTPKRRDALFGMILERAAAHAVASASVDEIDTLNILEASQLAMRRAVEALPLTPDYVLVDGNVARGFSQRTECLVGGDSRCAAIAAASILAKVSRDRHMLELAEAYPEYAFDKHKGYGTALHAELIRKHGPCPEHRMLFLRKILP